MTPITPRNTKIETLMESLDSKDGMIREHARESLVALGKPAVLSLTRALQTSTSDQVRWEAAKALGAICDARSIPVLIKALADSDYDVAWLAAEALINFKKTAWAPLLRTLTKKGPYSGLLRQGAHHVFANQKDDDFNDLLKPFIKALEPTAPPISAILAAYDILKRMKDKS